MNEPIEAGLRNMCSGGRIDDDDETESPGGGHERVEIERRVDLFGVTRYAGGKRSGSRREKGKNRKRTGQQAVPERESSDPAKCDRYPLSDTDAEVEVEGPGPVGRNEALDSARGSEEE
jgi:hypothetical protein